jgi:hypothetical protein
MSDGFMLKLDCVGKAFAFGVLDVTVVDSVVLRGCVEVPAANTVVSPCASAVCFFMNLNLAPHWR